MKAHPTVAENACKQCGEIHRQPSAGSYCDCGACLYTNGTQKGISKKELEMIPLVKCLLCGRINFWD